MPELQKVPCWRPENTALVDCTHRDESHTMERPIPLYEYMVLASSLEAARTVMRFPFSSSYSRHCTNEDQIFWPQTRAVNPATSRVECHVKLPSAELMCQ